MPRLLGVEIPADKRIEASLTYIYGIGFSTARRILEKTRRYQHQKLTQPSLRKSLQGKRKHNQPLPRALRRASHSRRMTSTSRRLLKPKAARTFIQGSPMCFRPLTTQS